MSLTAVLAFVVLPATAAVTGFGWSGPPEPPPPAEEAPVMPATSQETAAPQMSVPPPAPLPLPVQTPALPPPAPPEDGMRALRPIGLVATRDPAVAITFDACATRSHSYGFDRNVFNVLKREQIPATIFVSGRWVEGHPDVMAELAADPLIEFGDHSYDHPHMAHLPVSRIVEEIDQTETALARYGKRSVAFRPPFGEWSHRLIYVVQDLRLPTVTWDVVSGDPSARTTTDGMIRNVVSKARAGSIIIFHINGRGWKTAEALPAILRELRARGLRFAQLSELMAEGGGAPARAVPLPAEPAPAGGPAAVPIPAASIAPAEPARPPGPQ